MPKQYVPKNPALAAEFQEAMAPIFAAKSAEHQRFMDQPNPYIRLGRPATTEVVKLVNDQLPTAEF